MKENVVPQKTSTRKAILEATVNCIEKYGLDKLTIRRIAVEAGTNVASINYHFKSKDHLVSEAFSMTIKHMLQDVFAAIEEPAPAFDHVLVDVLFYLLDGGLRFPGISKAHLQRALNDSSRRTISAQAMVRVFDGLTQRAVLAYPAKTRADLRLRLSQILAGVMFTILKPDFFDLARQNRLTNSRQARALAESYARLFLSAI
jgi:TetR/AcrR family transcriptional regulator, regulator of cefoperazone and chloramphenicol sensitivity